MHIETNVKSVKNNVSNMIENINQLAAYPSESPELKKPREMADLIDYVNKDLKKYELMNNTDEELPI